MSHFGSSMTPSMTMTDGSTEITSTTTPVPYSWAVAGVTMTMPASRAPSAAHGSLLECSLLLMSFSCVFVVVNGFRPMAGRLSLSFRKG